MSSVRPNNKKYVGNPHEDEKGLSDLGEFNYIRLIREGGMSNILLYSLTKDGCQSEVVVKTFFRKSVSKRELAHLRTEGGILSSIDHENIIRIYGITETEFGFGLVLEYFPHGSYSEFFRNFREMAVNTNYEVEIAPLKIRIIQEIVSAMEYLHRPRKFSSFAKEKSILHLDLKGANVLLNQDLHAKICDFGLGMLSTLSKLRTGTAVHGGASGTSGFIAPERLKNVNCKPNTKCDVYSFGILQYEILTDLPPYPDFDANDLKLLAYYVAEKNYRPDVSNIPSCFPTELLCLMEQSWSAFPEKRPPFSEISRRVARVEGEIQDFGKRASYAVNFVMAILANENTSPCPWRILRTDSLPDLKSFSRIDSEDTDSAMRTSAHRAVENFEIPLTGTQETATSNASRISSQSVLDYDSITALPIAASYREQPDNPSITRKKAPISVDKVVRETWFSSFDNDDVPLYPATGPNENCKCSLFKILITSMIAGTLVASTILFVLRPWSQNYDDRIACGKPQITDGTVECTDHTFEGSTCYFWCRNHHFIQGDHSIFCQKNGNWSGPVPYCECSKCTMGDECEYSIRWPDIDNNLSHIQQDDERVELNYGGYTFVCWTTNVMQLNTTWLGSCGEPHVLPEAMCGGGGDFHNRVIAAKATASAFIRYHLVGALKYPNPCDSEYMPTSC